MGLTKVEREQRAAARAKQEAEREAERLLIAEEQALILAISRHYGLLLNDNTPRPDYDEEFDPGWGLPPSRFDALRHLMAGDMAAMGRRSHWFDRALLVDTPEARKAARREKHRGGPSDQMRLTGAPRTSVCGSVRSTYRVLTCALIAAPAADEYPEYPPCAHCLRILRRRAQAWEEGKTPEGEARAAREAAGKEWIDIDADRHTLAYETRQKLRALFAGCQLVGDVLDWLVQCIMEDRIGALEGNFFGVFDFKPTGKRTVRRGPKREIWGLPAVSSTRPRRGDL